MPIALRLKTTEKPPSGKSVRTRERDRDREKEKEPFQEEPKSPAAAALAGKGHRVLVVDDNPVVLKAFEMRLKKDGFEVSTIENAAGVASRIEESKAELVVLDINFPGAGAITWNGFTVIQWMQRFPELRGIPVILISGGDPAQYADKALKAGAVAFFQKPVPYRELVSTILRALEPK